MRVGRVWSDKHRRAVATSDATGFEVNIEALMRDIEAKIQCWSLVKLPHLGDRRCLEAQKWNQEWVIRDAEGEPGERDISDQKEGQRVKKLDRSVVLKKKKKHHSVNNNLEEIYHWIL